MNNLSIPIPFWMIALAATWVFVKMRKLVPAVIAGMAFAALSADWIVTIIQIVQQALEKGPR